MNLPERSLWCLEDVAPVFEKYGRVDGMDYMAEAHRMELTRLREVNKEQARSLPAAKLLQDQSSTINLPGSTTVADAALPHTSGLQSRPVSAQPKPKGESLFTSRVEATVAGPPAEAAPAWLKESEGKLLSALRSQQDDVLRKQQEEIGALRKDIAVLQQTASRVAQQQQQQQPASSGGCRIQ